MGHEPRPSVYPTQDVSLYQLPLSAHTTIPNKVLEKVYNILLVSGAANSPRQTMIDLASQVKQELFADAAQVFFYDANGVHTECYSVSFNSWYSSLYREHYAFAVTGRYNVFDLKRMPVNTIIDIIKWDEEEPTVFLREYITPLGFKISYSFKVFDMWGNVRCIVTLNWKKESTVTSEYSMLLKLLLPQLNNLYKNFFHQSSPEGKLLDGSPNYMSLTSREVQITTLISEGVSTANIAARLHIALSTVNKHLDNIYKKLNVSSRQELLLRLLR